MKRGLKNNNKFKFIIFLCIGMLFLTGFAFWETVPKLINADKPFIELSDSVGLSVSNAESAYNLSNPSPIPTMAPVATPVPLAPQKLVEVHVGNDEYDDAVKLRYGDYNHEQNFDMKADKREQSLENLKKQLEVAVKDGRRIRLIDNYAEKNAFLTILQLSREIDPQTEIFDDNGNRY
ncbi:MAG: hypothetical protein MJ131_11155 [Lachnospiraceae bacterium]|nr:hypothetical protein [Lachnospiraceae bacterium]